MSVSKIIAVVGATGATAGGLAPRSWPIPAAATPAEPSPGTRDRPQPAPCPSRAPRWSRPIWDDYDSLVRAFDGADAVFCMTNFFETFSAEQETHRPRTRRGRRRGAAGGLVDG